MIAILFLLVLMFFAIIARRRGDNLLGSSLVLMGLAPVSVDLLGGKAGMMVGGGMFCIIILLCSIRLFRYYKKINESRETEDPQE